MMSSDQSALEAQVRAALEAVAERSPQLGPQFEPSRRPRMRVPVWTVGLAATVVVIAGSFGVGAMISDGNNNSRESGLIASPSTGSIEDGRLVGTWRPIASDGTAVKTRDGWRSAPELKISADGTYSATDGCNEIKGAYRADGERSLNFDAGVSRLVSCNNYEHHLTEVRAGTFSGRTLTFLDPDDQIIATYERID